MKKTIATTLAAAFLVAGTAVPAQALQVQAPTDGWGIRSAICKWVPVWC